MALIDLTNDEISDMLACVEYYCETTHYDYDPDTEKYFKDMMKKLKDHLTRQEQKKCPSCDRYQLDIYIRCKYRSWFDKTTGRFRHIPSGESRLTKCNNCDYREDIELAKEPQYFNPT